MIATVSHATFDPGLYCAADFEQGSDGIWYTRERLPISYPATGNAECFDLEDRSFWFAHRNACLAAVMRRFPPQGDLFDVGGGNGYVARGLIAAGFPTVLVEPGEVGARNAIHRGLPAVVCSTLESAQLKAGKLPAVGLFDVLEHIERDADFLAEIRRALVPQGRLYITVPAFSWLWSDDDVDAGHFRRCSRAGWLERIVATGFSALFSSYFFLPIPLPLFALRAIPSLFGKRALPREKYASLHQPRSRSILDPALAAELRQIEKGHTLPFGSSCLFVLEKNG